MHKCVPKLTFIYVDWLLPCLCLLNDQASYHVVAYFQSDSYDFIHQPERLIISLASNYTYWNCQGEMGVQLTANGQKVLDLEKNQLVKQFWQR